MEKITYRVEELGAVVGGGTPSTQTTEYWDGDIPWISPADLTGYTNVYISRGAKNITEEGLKKSSTKLLPKGTVLLSSRAPIGYLAIAQNDICTNQGFKSIICNEDVVNNKYLYYFLKLNVEHLKAFASGATFPELSGNSLKRIKLYIAKDVNIQRRIADILANYDELVEANNKRIAILEQMAENLYKEWFVRFRFPGHETAEFEKGLPKGWEYVRFGKAIEIIDGDRGKNYPTQEEFYEQGECLFLNAGNVTKRGFDFSSCAYITKEKDHLLRKGKLQTNDVVLTTRGTVGNVAFLNDAMTFSPMRINSGMVILRNLGVVSPEYIYTALRHESLQKTMAMYASGSAQPQLPIKDMRRIKIINPDDATMRKFSKITSEIYQQISLLIMKNQTLTKQRDLLLPRLMSGKLEV